MSFFNTKSDNVDDRQEDKDVDEEINMTEDLMTYNNYGDFDVDVGVDFNIGNDEQYDVAASGGGFFGYLSEETQELSKGDTVECVNNTSEHAFFSFRPTDTSPAQELPPMNSDYISSDSSCSSGEGSNKHTPQQVRPKTLQHTQSRPSTAPAPGRAKLAATNPFKAQLRSPPGSFNANPFASALKNPFTSPPPLAPPPRPITVPAKPTKLPQHSSLGIADPARFAISPSKELFPTPVGVPGGAGARGGIVTDQIKESVKLSSEAAEKLSSQHQANIPIILDQTRTTTTSATAVTPFTPAPTSASSRGEMSLPLAQMRHHPTAMFNGTLISPPETVLERHMSPRSASVATESSPPSALPISIEGEPPSAKETATAVPSTRTATETSSGKEALQECSGMDANVVALDGKLRAAEVTVHAYKVELVAKLKAVTQLESKVLEKDWMCAAVPRILAAQHRLQAVRARWEALLLRDRDSSGPVSDGIGE